MQSREEVNLPLLQALFEEQLQDSRLQLRKDIDLPHLKSQGQWRVIFSVKCACGTSAMLYLDVSKTKTAEEVRKATPQLLHGLSAQADQFQRMPCDLHKKMALK